MFLFLTSELTFDDLELKLTLKMTVIHQNIIIIGRFIQNHIKKVLHTLLALLSSLLDLKIDLLTLKMTLNNQNFRYGLPSQNYIKKSIIHVPSFICYFVFLPT